MNANPLEVARVIWTVDKPLGWKAAGWAQLVLALLATPIVALVGLVVLAILSPLVFVVWMWTVVVPNCWGTASGLVNRIPGWPRSDFTAEDLTVIRKVLR